CRVPHTPLLRVGLCPRQVLFLSPLLHSPRLYISVISVDDNSSCMLTCVVTVSTHARQPLLNTTRVPILEPVAKLAISSTTELPSFLSPASTAPISTFVMNTYKKPGEGASYVNNWRSRATIRAPFFRAGASFMYRLAISLLLVLCLTGKAGAQSSS